jgi:hypothetical protein
MKLDLEKEIKEAFLKGYDEGGQTAMDFFIKVIDDVIENKDSEKVCSMRYSFRAVKFLANQFKEKTLKRED